MFHGDDNRRTKLAGNVKNAERHDGRVDESTVTVAAFASCTIHTTIINQSVK